MATTIQQIQDRAVAWSIANGVSSLVSDTAEIIARVAADERSLFDLAAETSSHYFAYSQSVTSSASSSARTIATTALTYPVKRILKLVLSTGSQVNQVDLRDLDAELEPRYYMLGTTITEVEDDWSAVSGAVNATLTYVRGPTALSASGALSQSISLDDQFADLLEMRLARYLAQKDVGRGAEEVALLDARIAERTRDFLSFLSTFGGVEVRRFNISKVGNKS